MKEPKQELLEGVKALGILAGFGGKIYRDKQISVTDFQYVVDLALQFNVLQEGFEGIGEARKAMDDMSKEDLLEILGALWDAADQYEVNRKA